MHWRTDAYSSMEMEGRKGGNIILWSERYTMNMDLGPKVEDRKYMETRMWEVAI